MREPKSSGRASLASSEITRMVAEGIPLPVQILRIVADSMSTAWSPDCRCNSALALGVGMTRADSWNVIGVRSSRRDTIGSMKVGSMEMPTVPLGNPGSSPPAKPAVITQRGCRSRRNASMTWLALRDPIPVTTTSRPGKRQQVGPRRVGFDATAKPQARRNGRDSSGTAKLTRPGLLPLSSTSGPPGIPPADGTASPNAGGGASATGGTDPVVQTFQDRRVGGAMNRVGSHRPADPDSIRHSRQRRTAAGSRSSPKPPVRGSLVRGPGTGGPSRFPWRSVGGNEGN